MNYGSDTYEETPGMDLPEYLGIALVTIGGFVALIGLWLIA